MGSIVLFLGILLFSFIVTSMAVVPFINLLYKLKFRRAQQQTKDAFGKRTPIYDKFHKNKAGVPVGGGLLIVVLVSVFFALMIPLLNYFGIEVTSLHQNSQVEINVLFFTFLSFAILGLYDDLKKIFSFEKTKIKKEEVSTFFIHRFNQLKTVKGFSPDDLEADISYIHEVASSYQSKNNVEAPIIKAKYLENSPLSLHFHLKSYMESLDRENLTVENMLSTHTSLSFHFMNLMFSAPLL